MDSVELREPLTLVALLSFMEDRVPDYHVWNELAHGKIFPFRHYNECKHTSCLIWNRFKPAECKPHISELLELQAFLPLRKYQSNREPLRGICSWFAGLFT